MGKTLRVMYNGYDTINVGDEVMLGKQSCDNGTPDRWFIVPNAPDGLGGNTNSQIKRCHGWRGTTSYGHYSVTTEAHGLRRIEKIESITDEYTGDVEQRVTVGEDLYPDRA